MNSIYRIIDANINRVSEGLRVLEDLARFKFGESNVTEEIKILRHRVRKGAEAFNAKLLSGRNSIDDIGLQILQNNILDNRANSNELIMANFKRVQEGLRVIEENFKIIGYYETAKLYEQYRYAAYTLEKLFYTLFIGRKKLQETDLYCITAEEHSKGRSNIEVVKELLDSGIKIIQYREKNKKMIEKYKECENLRRLTKEYEADFIINDDIDIAILVNADGVHIGQDDLPIEEVRKLVGDKMIVGLSTHSPAQARDAVQRGADYIGVGPIFRTYTKIDVCEPVGLGYLDYVVKNINLPFVAIGGIKEHNFDEIAACGAKCIALVTEIVSADNITKKIKDIRKKWAKFNNTILP